MTAKKYIRALEFYSGIGAFAQAAAAHDIEVLSSFDQSQAANQVYTHNYEHKPCSRNLDSISLNDIPDGDLWWLSPPCTPYSRRGVQKDMADPRAQSFLHLIDLMQVRKPPTIMIENVEGFLNSKMFEHLCQALQEKNYQVNTIKLCPTMFGIPMQRPRVFVVASLARQAVIAAPPDCAVTPLSCFVDKSLNDTEAGKPLLLSESDAEKYEAVLNVVDLRDCDGPSAHLICFTSGYYRNRKATGSLLRLESGRLRFFSPREILGLLRFAPSFTLSDLELPICYRLVGNSVDVRAIDYLLSSVLPAQVKRN
ncbi:DNA cytosine methyltransferase [soil metagenome]